jgi:AmiR/NasT family two-component response regulator
MEPISLVVYQSDPRTAQAMVVSLSEHFGSIDVAYRYEEVRPAIARIQADVLVLDMEMSHPDEIGRLHREFPSLCIVGTHRLADEQLWAEALNQGAADVCEPRNDIVVRSVLHECAQHAAA